MQERSATGNAARTGAAHPQRFSTCARTRTRLGAGLYACLPENLQLAPSAHQGLFFDLARHPALLQPGIEEMGQATHICRLIACQPFALAQPPQSVA